MARPTHDKIASSYVLWHNYIDPHISINKFLDTNHADRMALIIETFGPEPEPVPTVEQVLVDTATGFGMHRWNVEGGSLSISTEDLRPLLEEAYDPGMPNWVALVSDFVPLVEARD